MTEVTLIRPHVNPDVDFDSRHQASGNFFSNERSPEPGDWGLRLGGDASAAIGGQVMTFN